MTDSSLPWIPTFLFGVGETLTLTYPVTRWNPGARTTGRSLTTISGIIDPALQLRKYTLGMTLCLLETELDAVVSFLTVVQMGDAFIWQPNAQDPDVDVSVDVLHELPRVNEQIKPTRDAGISRLFILPIVIARTSAPWGIEYFKLPTGM
jgi:hypothetical protein